ncbi:MAG TPA: hexose kinase [Solirubrobacteraceae bacterium]|nr:hexose kinase [Solirubrobacteraceae bacterium]
MILCVAANPSIDKLFEVDVLKPGEIHRPRRFVQLPGGKGIHVAQVASQLGADAVVTGILGGHAGHWVAEALAAEGVASRFTWTARETRSSLSVADRETGRLTEFYEAGVPVTDDDWRGLESTVRSLLPGAAWVTLAGSLPPGAPPDGYARLLTDAREAGLSVALDTRGEALARTLREGPQLVKINAYEAEQLLGEPVAGIEDAQRAAAEVRARAGGPGHAAVVTAGEQGMAMAGPDGNVWRGWLDARGGYPVGSGDAFLGGMLVALERGEPWPTAVALGLGAASANAEVAGAGRLDPERARALAGAAEVRPASDTPMGE